MSSTKGTSTDNKGTFKLPYTPSDKQLIFSYTGYQTDTLEIKSNKALKVVMSEGKILEDLVVEFKKGSYSFSKIDPRNAHIIGQDELRKAACCNLAESFETNPSIDATFTDAITGTKQIQMLGLSGKYVQMLSGNIPVIRGLSTLYGLKQIPGSFIHQISGSVLNGYESMIGQINMNVKQPENAEKFHFNFYLNQAGRTEYNTFFSKNFGRSWSGTFLAHFEDQSRTNDRNNDGFLDNPLHKDYIFYNQWNYRSRLIHMEIGGSAVFSTMNSGKRLRWADSVTTTQPDYGLDIENSKLNGFLKIGYLFPDDNFKSLALQLSSTYNRQNFIESIITNSEKFGIISGLRLDYTSYYRKYFLTPRLHLRYSPNTDLAFKIMAGSGRRTPFMIMENIGFMASSRKWSLNSYGLFGLGQEYSWNFGAAILKEFTLFNREGTLTIDAYHTFFENQLVVDLDESARQVDFYALNGRSFSNSFQTELNYNFNRRWAIRTAYRFLDVKKDYQSGLKEKPLLSKHRGFVNIAYSSRKQNKRQWKIDLTTQLVGSQRIPYTGDNAILFQLDLRSKGYLVTSGQITRIFSPKVDAYLGIENAFNYTQSDPILSSENPYSEHFDSSLIWAPIFGRMIYLGFRFTLKD